MIARTAGKPPVPPDILPDGTPKVMYLRTSRARQVNFNPTIEPVARRKMSARPLYFVGAGMVVVFGAALL